MHLCVCERACVSWKSFWFLCWLNNHGWKMAPSSKMILVSKGAIVPKILFAKSVQNGCELIQVFVIKKIYVCVCNVTFFSSYLEVTKDF